MNSSKTGALIRALLVSYMVSGLLLLALSFALYRLKLKEAQINQAVFAVYGIACLTGFCMRKNNWKPTIFLGTFQRTALFCSTLCSLPGSKSRCFSYFQPDSHRDASLHRCRRYWRNPQLNLFYRVLSTSPYLNMAVDTFRKNLFFHRTCFPTERFCSHRT